MPWLDASFLDPRRVEAYVDCDGHLPGNVRLSWLSTLEWERRCLLLTHFPGSSQLPRNHGCRPPPYFRSSVGPSSWLIWFKFSLLVDGLSVCPSKFGLDLWRYHMSSEVFTGEELELSFQTGW